MNNQDLIKELKRIRFRTVYDKLEYVRPLIALERDFNVITDRYLRKIKRFLADEHTYPSIAQDLGHQNMMDELAESLCYELKVTLSYSKPELQLSDMVSDLLFLPENLDEQTLGGLRKIVLELIEYQNE